MGDNKSVLQILLSAVGGAFITGLFALHTSNQNAQLEREKLDLQRQLENQKIQYTVLQKSQESLNQDKKNLLLRKEEHRKNLIQAAAELRAQYWTVHVRSRCEHSVQMAWNYEALDGVRVTEGWFTVLPDKPTPTITTRNPETYYYARTGMFPNIMETPQVLSNPRFQWDPVSSFVYFEAEYRPSGKTGSDFQGFLIPGHDWGPQTLEFSCSSFTPRPPE
jgi:hypothetical protein